MIVSGLGRLNGWDRGTLRTHDERVTSLTCPSARPIRDQAAICDPCLTALEDLDRDIRRAIDRPATAPRGWPVLDRHQHRPRRAVLRGADLKAEPGRPTVPCPACGTAYTQRLIL